MGLKVKIRLHLTSVMDQDIVHGHIVRAQMLGARQDGYLREILAYAVHDRIRIRIDQDLRNLRDRQQGPDDVMEQRLACQQPIIFARHTLAVMTHGNKSNEFRHGSK